MPKRPTPKTPPLKSGIARGIAAGRKKRMKKRASEKPYTKGKKGKK